MKIDLVDNIFVVDFGYIGQSLDGNKIYREGDEKETIARIELPILSGTEKQIAYAESIRNKAIDSMCTDIDKIGIEGFMKKANVNTAQKVIDMILKNNKRYNWIINETSAKTIIER